MASEEVHRVWEEVQTAAVWGAGRPAEASPPVEPSAGCRSPAATSGRPLEDGWAYP